MPIYDVNGNQLVSVGGAGITVKKNNPMMVSQFLNVAQSYLNQTDIEYIDGDTIMWKSTATNGIDCSTFVWLCLMGIPYEKSPYYTHNYVNPLNLQENTEDFNWTFPSIQYKISRFIDGSNPDENVRLACQLARLMQSRGQEVPLSNGFRDVMPGDIVFWSSKKQSTGEYSRPDWFMHISHVGIILNKESAPNTYIDDQGNTRTWNKTKYPYKHQIIEVTLETPPCINSRWLEKRQEDETYMWGACVNTISMICRPDFGALSPSTT